MKKATILFLALLFPACVFVFLKYFGKNRFDVPPLFMTELPADVKGCSDSVELPYKVPQFIQAKFSVSSRNFTLVYIQGSEQVEKILAKVKDKFGDKLNYQAADSFKDVRCPLLLSQGQDMTIIDREASIRGQYQSGDRDDVDRLMMELSILFEDY